MKTCPSCQSSVDLSTDICPICGWRFSAGVGQAARLIARPAARPKIQCEIDLAATVDRTGSSERFKSGIPTTYDTILNQVQAKARSVKCWLASHGDLDEGQDFILHTDAGTPAQALQDMKNITYGGGGDPPEHHLDAIESLLNRVPWTADPTRARGAILAFMTADSKPAKSGTTAGELGKRIRQQGILLYLVCEPTPTLLELAKSADGLVFEITNNPDPAELQKIAAQLAASIVASVASGSTVPMAAIAN